VLLWLLFVRDPDFATLVNVNILFRAMPRDLEISSELPDRVRLEIFGPSRLLTPESLTDAAVVFSLAEVDSPGDRAFTITAENTRLPDGVAFSRAVPSQVRIHFEQRVSREVTVRPRISKYPPAGYTLKQVRVDPQRLRVVGPESDVTEVPSVDTDSIDLSRVTGPAEMRMTASVANPRVRFESTPVVRVTVLVERTR
jgi:YbbR domain-containing protein